MSTEKEIALHLKTTLEAASVYTDVVGTRTVPLYALAGTQFPFVVYSFGDVEEISKDGAEEYTVFVTLAFAKDQYDACADFKAVVREVLKDTEFTYAEATGVESDKEDEGVHCTLRYTIIDDGVSDGGSNGGGNSNGNGAVILSPATSGDYYYLMEGQVVSIPIIVDNPQNVTRYYANSLPDFLVVNEETGLITGTVPEGAEGSYTIGLRINHLEGVDSEGWAVKVVAYNINTIYPPQNVAVLEYNTVGVSFQYQYENRFYSEGYEALEFFVNDELYRTFSESFISVGTLIWSLMQSSSGLFQPETPFSFKSRLKGKDGVYSDFSEELMITIPDP